MTNKNFSPLSHYIVCLSLVLQYGMIVSGIVIYLHLASKVHFIAQWLGAFITAWPIVFIAILLIAPLVNKLLNLFVEDKS